MSDQYGGPGPGDEQPGPYQGVFGSSGQPGPPQPPPYGGRPGPYGGSFGQPNPYSYQPGPVTPPKQVTVASAISLGMGGLCILVGGFALTSAGEKMAEMLTGSKDAQEVLAAAFLFCAIAYILPGLFLRKRRRWARIMLIIVAAIGISGGASALPGSLIGLTIHATLLILLLQQPSRLWFQRR